MDRRPGDLAPEVGQTPADLLRETSAEILFLQNIAAGPGAQDAGLDPCSGDPLPAASICSGLGPLGGRSAPPSLSATPKITSPLPCLLRSFANAQMVFDTW